MKLLFLNYEYPPIGGGAATASRHLIREWTAMGCEVRVLTTHYPGLPWREETDGAIIHRLPAFRRRPDRGRIGEMAIYMAGASLVAPVLAARWRPDAALAFIGIPSGPVTWLLRQLTGVPYVVCLRGGDVPGFRCEGVDRFHRLLAPMTRTVWRQAAAVTANSAGLADLAKGFMPGLDIPVIPNGVDSTLFHPAVPVRAVAGGAAATRSSDGPVRLLAVGRLVAQKGIDVLIDALARPGLGNVALDVVGDGEWRDALERQAAGHGLAGRVRIHGWLSRAALAEVYRKADVFVLPSRDEGMPNVVLEAMASGLPVVASAVAGACDLVVEGETGFLVPPEDPDALAAALRRLAGDAALRAGFGGRGRERVEESFSWRSAASSFLTLVEERREGGGTMVRKTI
ncbi:glycosyltransferase involved in cell wall biosynthesis [Azospirillum agricola]|uniref:glycosyltransferase family 4 protein n=1 Tax=Azospirillum agricola TaxID=1720247 RepID=UPI001AEB921F|nr:glycosyltransferase [Azospirillum agricola]MBP2232988.1 glycosyltransferase involved in cell wall biosynthesis [Azospirillum agricola]